MNGTWRVSCYYQKIMCVWVLGIISLYSDSEFASYPCHSLGPSVNFLQWQPTLSDTLLYINRMITFWAQLVIYFSDMRMWSSGMEWKVSQWIINCCMLVDRLLFLWQLSLVLLFCSYCTSYSSGKINVSKISFSLFNLKLMCFMSYNK